MRRRAGQIVSFLVAGAMLNLALTWGLALWADWPVQLGQLVRSDPAAAWPITVGPHWPEQPRVIIRARSFGYLVDAGMSRLRVDDPVEGPTVVDFRADVHRLGWPLPSLAWHRLMDDRSFTTPWGLEVPGVLNRLNVDSRRRLPLLAQWPGAALNPLLFAAAVLLLLRGPRLLVAVRRRLCGLCPGCGYPVGGSPICTECGGALKRPRVGPAA